MHNPEREAKKADRISRSKTFKPRITSTDYDSFTFKCRLCMMGFRRRGMLVSAKRPPDSPVSVYEDAFVRYSVRDLSVGFVRGWGKSRKHIMPNLEFLAFQGPSALLFHSSFLVTSWERTFSITFHY